jgi:hypothetical protein
MRVTSKAAFMLCVVAGALCAARASVGVSDLQLAMAEPALLSAFGQTSTGDTSTAEATAASDDVSCETSLEAFTTRQYRAIKVHKALAFTTAGLVLAADGMGLYHFLQLVNRGHDLCPTGGEEDGSFSDSLQTAQTQEAWSQSESQAERVIHAGLIAGALIAYTATATIELTMPRTHVSQRPLSQTKLHKYLFWLHCGLMVANVGLGFWESYALSEGDHDLSKGLGIAHLAVGFSVPVVMVISGLSYKLPIEY